LRTDRFFRPLSLSGGALRSYGLLDEARVTIARLRALTPEVIPTYQFPFRDPSHRELYFSGLRLAMGATE
jgi:hypothetical protein